MVSNRCYYHTVTIVIIKSLHSGKSVFIGCEDHGYLHRGNICLNPERDDNKVYIIDFDTATETSTEETWWDTVKDFLPINNS